LLGGFVLRRLFCAVRLYLFFVAEFSPRTILVWQMSVAGYSIELSKKGDRMSSYYPEGSMRGSGIYQEDYTGTFYCSACDDEYSLDGTTDDWGYNDYDSYRDSQMDWD
jgi:hypothetical protein